MKFGYYGRTSLLLSAAAECPLLRVQGDMKPCHLLLKPTNTNPTGIPPAGSTAFISHPTNPEVIHMLSADNLVYQLGSVPTASPRLLRRRGTNPVTSAIFPIQGCVSAGRLWSESGTPPASL